MCCTYSVLVRPLVLLVLQNNTYYSPLIYQAEYQNRTGQRTKPPILSGSKHPLEMLITMQYVHQLSMSNCITNTT